MRCWCDWIRRFDAGNWGSEVDKWCHGAGLRVRPWVVSGGSVPGGLAPGGLGRSALTRLVAQRSSSVSRYFGLLQSRNRSRSRTPNCTELETETEPKNRTTDYSVQFGSVFGFR